MILKFKIGITFLSLFFLFSSLSLSISLSLALSFSPMKWFHIFQEGSNQFVFLLTVSMKELNHFLWSYFKKKKKKLQMSILDQKTRKIESKNKLKSFFFAATKYITALRTSGPDINHFSHGVQVLSELDRIFNSCYRLITEWHISVINGNN